MNSDFFPPQATRKAVLHLSSRNLGWSLLSLLSIRELGSEEINILASENLKAGYARELLDADSE